jgi:DNA helicase-2/ATP-dependent DNA helicase PcrA
LLEHYQQRFQHLLVDEFQDTNTIQYAWLRVLAGSGSAMPLVAVGDDDQSIYGWRGAKIENIQQFTSDFPATRTVRLEQNYRSTATILKAANAVISHNIGRLGKELWTAGDEGEPISLFAGFNETDEARFIAEQVETWHERGRDRKGMAVLYRSNAQSRVLEEAFMQRAIPYRIYGGQRFYDRVEVKNVLAYLRLMLGRENDPAIERVINTPPRGVGARTVEVLREQARAMEGSLWVAMLHVEENQLLPARALKALAGFRELVDDLSTMVEEMDLPQLVDHVIGAVELIEYHKKEKGERGQARVENLQELVSAARSFHSDDDDSGPLQLFLDGAALDAGAGQAGEDEDSVQMMTLHSAKGLEYPIVFLSGVEENLFPHRMSLEEPGRLEEERRLCYVGLTRAMEKLYISYAETRRLHGSDSYNAPSRFIREIPADLLEEVRVGTSFSLPTSFSAREDLQLDGLALGQRVLHQVFGEGVILNFEGGGSNGRVQVNFDSEGSKWLVLQYANLQQM